MTMARATSTGQPYSIQLHPPPGDRRCAPYLAGSGRDLGTISRVILLKRA